MRHRLKSLVQDRYPAEFIVVIKGASSLGINPQENSQVNKIESKKRDVEWVWYLKVPEGIHRNQDQNKERSKFHAHCKNFLW